MGTLLNLFLTEASSWRDWKISPPSFTGVAGEPKMGINSGASSKEHSPSVLSLGCAGTAAGVLLTTAAPCVQAQGEGKWLLWDQPGIQTQLGGG